MQGPAGQSKHCSRQPLCRWLGIWWTPCRPERVQNLGAQNETYLECFGKRLYACRHCNSSKRSSAGSSAPPSACASWSKSAGARSTTALAGDRAALRVLVCETVAFFTPQLHVVDGHIRSNVWNRFRRNFCSCRACPGRPVGVLLQTCRSLHASAALQIIAQVSFTATFHAPATLCLDLCRPARHGSMCNGHRKCTVLNPRG